MVHEGQSREEMGGVQRQESYQVRTELVELTYV